MSHQKERNWCAGTVGQQLDSLDQPRLESFRAQFRIGYYLKFKQVRLKDCGLDILLPYLLDSLRHGHCQKQKR